MGKTKRSAKELDDVSRIKHENAKLKRTIAALRRQLSRIDIDRYQNLKDTLNREDAEEFEQIRIQEDKDIESAWKCFDCAEGVLRIHTIQRQDGTFYYRRCDCCPKKTKLQRLTSATDGIFAKPKV